MHVITLHNEMQDGKQLGTLTEGKNVNLINFSFPNFKEFEWKVEQAWKILLLA